jgi:hypothetical protein
VCRRLLHEARARRASLREKALVDGAEFAAEKPRRFASALSEACLDDSGTRIRAKSAEETVPDAAAETV